MVNIIKKNIVAAVGINLLFLILYLVFSTCRLNSLDDYFMSAVLTGAYGSEYDVHLYFINAIFGYFLKPFYFLLPSVGWYYIFELLEVFVSFSVFSYLLIDRLGKKYGLIFSFLLLTCVAPDFYYQVGFTQCAEVTTAAGMLLIFLGNWKNHKKRLVLGGLLFVVGFVMRTHAFYMGLPYIFVFLGARIIIEKKIPWPSVVALFFSALTIVFLFNFDRSLYSEGEYKYYADFQKPRAVLGDGAYYDREATFAELNEREARGEIFRAGWDWLTYDTEAFSLDSLPPIMDAINNNLYSMNPGKTVFRMFVEFTSALFNTNAWCWVILCVVIFICGSRYGCLYPWVSLGVIVFCFTYLLMVNRVLYHVQVGVWVYAIAGALPFIDGDLLNQYTFSKKIYSLFILACVAGYCYSYSSQPVPQRQSLENTSAYKGWVEFKKYAEQHDSDAFMLSFSQYKNFATNIQKSSFHAIEPGSWGNIFTLGYWNIHLPGMKRELEKRGIENPLKSIAKENVYLVELPLEFVLKPNKFYEWHYRQPLQADTIASFVSYKLVKYKIAEVAK